MMFWLTNHFFNPTLLAGGAALLALPILIHLINRLRYRRVRFAAMEFLLQSQQRNRRRILLEQILLLLMRIAIVAAIVLLIARLILDPTEMSLFRGAKVHHVVLLDDSGSMQQRWGETSAFKEALSIVGQLLSEGAQRPDTQSFSLLRLSQPEQPFVSQRDVNEAFVLEMVTKLDSDVFSCTHQQLDLLKGLREARRYMSEEKGAVQHLHVLSDFRERDWTDQKALATAIDELSAAGISVNLVKTVPQAAQNLAVTELSAPVQIAAMGVPLRLKMGVTNYGTEVARNVRVTVADDGIKLPLAVAFETIEPGATVFHEADIRLESPTQHRLEARLEADVLEMDNTRFLAINVAPNIPVLIVEGGGPGEGASYVADALAADPASTGVSVAVDGPEGLRRRNLNDFRVIFLLDVPELAPDAVAALEEFVRRGGGLAWYLGPKVRPPHYNEALYAEGRGIFPVRLGAAPRDLAADPTSSEPDLRPANHPLFAVLQGQDNPFLASVHVRRYFPEMKETETTTGSGPATELLTGRKWLAQLRNNDGYLVEGELGAGRILACLGTADPSWNDWARNPSYVVYHLDLLKHLARRDRTLPQREVGQPIELELDPALYLETVEIASPSADGERLTRLQASPSTRQVEPPAAGESPKVPPEPLRLLAEFRDTDTPGTYRIQLLNQAQQAEQQLLAYNVSPAESAMELATTANLRKRLNSATGVQIQEPGQFQWLQGEEAGSEIRRALLWGLLLLLLLEQALAYRMSYHRAGRWAGAAA